MSKLFSRPRVIGAAAVGLVGALAFGAGFALADQPHMQSALGFLQSARAELAMATPDKGGHRVKALGDVDAAIAQVKLGIAFAR